MKLRQRAREAVLFLLFGFLCHVVITTYVFRFRHPWMTETQLFLHFFDALAMKQLERPRP